MTKFVSRRYACVSLLLCACFLAGCGQQGKLYLPEEEVRSNGAPVNPKQQDEIN